MAVFFKTLFIGLVLLLNQCSAATVNPNEKALVEQLFLDISVFDVLNDTDGMPIIQPWGDSYVSAVREKRYGDAIWARYHMMGEVKNGLVGDTKLTVMESIKADAMGYKANVPELFATALSSIYSRVNVKDTHKDVLDLLVAVSKMDVSHLVQRATFGISCSSDNLAYTTSCQEVLDRMSQSRDYVGDRRQIYTIGTCNLRVGPWRPSADVTYYTVHAVAQLIEGHCTRVPGCCNTKKTSGYSPENSGHRKICLSSKTTGCY